MHLKLLSFILSFVLFTSLNYIKASPFTLGWQPLGKLRIDTIPAPPCPDTIHQSIFQALAASKVHSWIEKYIHERGNKYQLFYVGTCCIYKMNLVSGASITLNKGASYVYESKSGIFNGLSGQAYVETKDNCCWFFVNKTTTIRVNPHTTVDIRAARKKRFIVSLVKGGFMVFKDKKSNTFNDAGIQYSFDPAGMPTGNRFCDNAQVRCWTENADFVTFYDDGTFKTKPAPST